MPSCRERYSSWYWYKRVCLSHDFHIVIDRDFQVEKFTVGGLYDGRSIEYWACCFTHRRQTSTTLELTCGVQ